MRNSESYQAGWPGFEKVFDFLRRYEEKPLGEGRYEIDGERIFAFVQHYGTMTPEQAKWEAHRKYIDIQYVSAGHERIGCCSMEHCREETPYSESDDAAFYQAGEEADWETMGPQDFAVFFPHDVHAPRVRAASAEMVRKVVVKVAV